LLSCAESPYPAAVVQRAEGKVSVDGHTYRLSQPFVVLATMNPVERFGSFELPESQLDRFMLSVSLGYPARSYEMEILVRDLEHLDAEQLTPVTDPESLRKLQDQVQEVKVDGSVMEYLLDLIAATREHPEIRLGLSSRGGLHLKHAMQALALLEGRDYAVPEDLRRMFVPVARHRVLLSAGAQGRGPERRLTVLAQILKSVEGPV